MDKMLVIDSSREFILIGLVIKTKYQFKLIAVDRNISTKLLVEIEQFLQEHNLSKHDLTAICCGRGPGSFTGIRVSMSVAKTLAYVLQLKLYSISSLVLYGLFSDKQQFISLDDARSNKLYYNVFNKKDGSLEEGIIVLEELSVIKTAYPDYFCVSTLDLVKQGGVIKDFSTFDLKTFMKFIQEEDKFLFKPTYIKEVL